MSANTFSPKSPNFRLRVFILVFNLVALAFLMQRDQGDWVSLGVLVLQGITLVFYPMNPASTKLPPGGGVGK